jgi:prepilin-type N-terminal cleavage/methylation domain-containing protein
MDTERFWARTSDAGFTLAEVLVSMAVIMVVMVPMSSFFVSSVRFDHAQGLRQAAAQLALDGMEKARGLQGPALLRGRAACSASCPAPVAAAAAYLTGGQRWDAPAADGAQAPVPRPNAPVGISLDGMTFQQYWYLSKCWQPYGGGTCDADSSKPVVLVRAVVAVTWLGQECPQAECAQVTSALLIVDATDPIFNA